MSKTIVKHNYFVFSSLKKFEILKQNQNRVSILEFLNAWSAGFPALCHFCRYSLKQTGLPA